MVGAEKVVMGGDFFHSVAFSNDFGVIYDMLLCLFVEYGGQVWVT